MTGTGETLACESRVVVLAHPRSGSNSLVEVLERHPALSIVNEPFNENFASWGIGNPDYFARLQSGEDFGALIDELFAVFTGLKELSYQLDGDCLARLLARPELKVVALRRRNLLQTAVSQLIAEQTGLWKTWDAVGPLEDYYRDPAPLDLDDVADRMRWTANEVKRAEAALAELPPERVLRVDYEDLYLGAAPDQQAWLALLWEFLGLAPCQDPAIAHYLSADVRQARPSTYGTIPNRGEIEAVFGDDHTGHLERWQVAPISGTST